MMPMLERYARYPFLPEAKEFISEKGISVAEIISYDIEENRALQDAWNRVFGAFLGKISFIPSVEDEVWEIIEKIYRGAKVNPADILDASERMRGVYENSEEIDVPHSEESLIARILSYPLARIMVSCIGDKRFMKRYALKEAELFRKLLEKEWHERRDRDFFVEIGEKLGLSVRIGEDWASMDAISYVKNTAQMKDPRKKLLFQDVRGGMVYFHRKSEGDEHMDVIFRSFQQALQEKIDSELPLNVPDELCNAMGPIIAVLNLIISNYYENYSLKDLGEVEVEKFPPCMKRLYSMAKSGINLPHSGRFALTAFLHHIGMSVDEIVKVFSASPDFNESITRYQVRHIAGEISGVEYMPQKCSVMVSEGLCYNPDELCRKEWMTHPLIYYRVKKEGKRRGKSGKNRNIQG
jgi:DNA primase large subunit